MIQYNLFYRQFGIRRVAQLLNPPLPYLDKLILPKNSLYHYPGEGMLDDGPKSDEFLFRNITRPIMLGNVTTIGDNKGNPRKLTIPVDPLIRSYFIRNRRFRKLLDVTGIPKDPMLLTVMNYSFIPRLYRYMRSVYSDYNRWYNQQAAVWKNAQAIAEHSAKEQFYVVKLPNRLPSINELKLADMQMNQRMAKTFSDPDSMMILELWKWLGEKRNTSVFKYLEKKNLDRVNLIFIESGRFFVLNLGVLNSWRSSTKEELIMDPEANTKGFDPLQLQKRFLRLLISLFDVRTSSPDENIGTADTTSEDEINDIYANTDTLTPEEDQERKDAAFNEIDSASDIEENFEEDDKIDKELAELERIAKLTNVDINPEYDEFIDDDSDDDGDDTFSQPDVAKGLETELLNVTGVESKTLEDALMKVCDRYAENGLISASDYKRYRELGESYKTIISPDGTTTLDKFIQIKPDELKIPDNINIPDNELVLDKTMLKSSLLVFDEYYIKNILQRDVASMVMNIQKAGIAVTDYQVERVETILGAYDEYTVKINPVDGMNSTLRFKLPVIGDDGVWIANGSRYVTRKQRGDLPILKTSPTTVALSSYYSKTFVTRSTKKVNDYGEWIRNHITSINLDPSSDIVKELYQSKEFDNKFMCPKIYSILSMDFKGFVLRPNSYPRSVGRRTYQLDFDHRTRADKYGQDVIKALELDGSIVVGRSDEKQFLVVDKNNVFYHADLSDGKNDLIAIGDIESMLNLDSSKAPVEFAELKVLGRIIPIGIVLGYEMGIEKLIKLLKADVRRVPVGTRVNLQQFEYAIVFNDETLVFNKDDTKTSMIMAGFNQYHKAIREFNVHDFDDKSVYLNVLETQGLTHRYLREIDSMYQLFVDPITRDLLIEMKEPTTFRGLLLRCCELLRYDQHPDTQDGAYMRVKGYERLAGAVYTEITKAIRAHAGRPGKSRLPIDLNPYQVWMAITTDTAKVQISEINPVENLKQQEALTYSGSGGRTSRTMTKETRAYHENDMGVVSEATVDSSDVGVNMYTSANPVFMTVRGLSRRLNRNKDGLSSLISSSVLLAPSGTKDDLRRAGFVSIQNKHVVDCDGYHQMQIRTGYESVVPHRTGDLFAYTARKDGVVKSSNSDGIIIEYEDGEQKGFQLGRRFGHAAGLTIPHHVTSNLKKGDKFTKGDVICYNTGFFEKDMLNPKQIVFKSAMLVNTVLMESAVTLEDSSAISTRLSSKLTSRITKVRTIVLNFSQNIHRLVKPGDEVNVEDILCIIEDPVGGSSGLLDDESLDTLRALSAQTPLAKIKGTVERVEVYYHGDKEDMNDSLRLIADQSDKEIVRRNKSAGLPLFNGSVDDSFRVDGAPLMLDTLAIQIYITSNIGALTGDKAVFANQLKTVIGEVLENEVRTESGKVVDAIFGKLSVDNRIVGSVDEMGTTNTLLDLLADRAVRAYNS